MNRSLMSYREAAPSADVAHLVFSFWEFTTADEDFGMIEHEIFPDGCISLYYHRNERFRLRELFFTGLFLESAITPVFPADVFWGMRLSPASCARLLESDLEEFRTAKRTEAAKFPRLSEGLLEKLDACESFQEAVAAFENHLRALDFGGAVYDEKVAAAVRLIEETGGEIKIAELARKLGLSTRQLERRFKAASGLSPKQFSRPRRIRATAVDLVENEKVNWAERAAEMGFTDQAHLAHEFMSVTKRSPNSFAEQVGRIKHGKLVK